MFLSLQIAFGIPEVNKVEANSNTAEANGGNFFLKCRKTSQACLQTLLLAIGDSEIEL